MSAILRDLPFRQEADEVAVGLERIVLKPYQIIVWVSITGRGVLELPHHARRIPTILDTGHNHNFSIQSKHLSQWAAVDEATLQPLGSIREHGRRAVLRSAHVWIHRNVPGKRDDLSSAPPYRLRLDHGIVLYPSETSYPRLPLLGLRALVRNNLHFTLDSERSVVHLRTPGLRTKLLRWLS